MLQSVSPTSRAQVHSQSPATLREIAKLLSDEADKLERLACLMEERECDRLVCRGLTTLHKSLDGVRRFSQHVDRTLNRFVLFDRTRWVAADDGEPSGLMRLAAMGSVPGSRATEIRKAVEV